MPINCPNCLSLIIKRNGKTHNGKQNHKCLECNRQFVLNPENHITDYDKEIIKKLLLERITLRGICRVMNISMTWLLDFVTNVYEQIPQELGVVQRENLSELELEILCFEIDEAWSFVQKKENKVWLWFAYDTYAKQIIAFQDGKRDKKTLRKLWEKIPLQYRKNSDFCSDKYEAYYDVIPKSQHYDTKQFTTHIERFFASMRNRVSRMVRKNLAFSKKYENHILALKYFIHHYNITQQLLALPL